MEAPVVDPLETQKPLESQELAVLLLLQIQPNYVYFSAWVWGFEMLAELDSF